MTSRNGVSMDARAEEPGEILHARGYLQPVRADLIAATALLSLRAAAGTLYARF